MAVHLSCGQTAIVSSGKLRSSWTRSCGCLLREARVLANTRHGHARKGKDTSKLYKSWAHLKSRCLNPNDPKYPDYGGRGITVCDRWINGDGTLSGFECFAADMGPHPGKGYTIDRIDNDGPYAPENCRWSTAAEQARNTRRTRHYTLNGETLCLTDWARRNGMSDRTLRMRLLAGWDIERALHTPVATPSNQPIAYEGKAQTLTDWSQQTGIDRGTLAGRIQRGWDLARAFTTAASTMFRPRLA